MSLILCQQHLSFFYHSGDVNHYKYFAFYVGQKPHRYPSIEVLIPIKVKHLVFDFLYLYCIFLSSDFTVIYQNFLEAAVFTNIELVSR